MAGTFLTSKTVASALDLDADIAYLEQVGRTPGSRKISVRNLLKPATDAAAAAAAAASAAAAAASAETARATAAEAGIVSDTATAIALVSTSITMRDPHVLPLSMVDIFPGATLQGVLGDGTLEVCVRAKFVAFTEGATGRDAEAFLEVFMRAPSGINGYLLGMNEVVGGALKTALLAHTDIAKTLVAEGFAKAYTNGSAVVDRLVAEYSGGDVTFKLMGTPSPSPGDLLSSWHARISFPGKTA